MATGKAVSSLGEEWARVCHDMDRARIRYCEAAGPVVAEREAAASAAERTALTPQQVKEFVDASDQWALAVAAVNAFARKHLRVA